MHVDRVPSNSFTRKIAINVILRFYPFLLNSNTKCYFKNIKIIMCIYQSITFKLYSEIGWWN